MFFKCNNKGSISPNLDIPNGDLDGSTDLICQCIQVKNTDKIIYVLEFSSNKLKKKSFLINIFNLFHYYYLCSTIFSMCTML